MGLVFSLLSKFRKKTTTKEVLLQIDEDIDKLKSRLQQNHQLKNKCVWLLLLISITAYVVFGAAVYFWYMPKKWSTRVIYLLPFLGFPVVVFLLKKLLHFIFVTRISKNSKALEVLKKEKKKILENVMETETYKVAKEILEKFDPDRKLVEKESQLLLKSQTPGSDLRKRNSPTNTTGKQPQMFPNGSPAGRIIHGPGMRTPNPNQIMRMQQPNFIRGNTPMMSPQHIPNAPILPRDRSVFDKVAEYFVGDGPSNRYALICKQCYSHNGMALAEEFAYTAYKCCYCSFFNPPRKQRLIAPKVLNKSIGDSGNSSSDDASIIDSEKIIVKESDIIKEKKDDEIDELVENATSPSSSTPVENIDKDDVIENTDDSSKNENKKDD